MYVNPGDVAIYVLCILEQVDDLDFVFSFFLSFLFLQCQITILWSHWYFLFRTSVGYAHLFQSQGGSIIACALISLVHNDPQSQL